MALQKVEIKTYFGQCKCCLNYGYLKNMWEPHWAEEDREIYGQMLVDCFLINWTIRDKAENDKICEVCISRLRDALSFKKQVLQSQIDLLEVSKTEEHDISWDQIENSNSECEVSDNDQKNYEHVEFLEEEIFDEGGDKNEDNSLDSQPEKKKCKSPQVLTKSQRQKPYKQYLLEDLSAAIEKVKSKKMTEQEAADTYNVPRKTINFKIRQAGKENLDRKKAKEFINGVKAILTHTNATPFRRKGNSYYCFFCPFDAPAIEDPEELRKHTHSVHTDKVTQVEFELRPHPCNQMIRVDVVDLTCNCNTKANWHNMLNHLETEHEVTFREARKRIIPFTLTKNTDEMPCTLCYYSSCFTNVDSHMNTHYKNYICGECGDTYITISRLNAHSQSHKHGIFPCNACDKVFYRHQYRRRHIDMVHDKKLVFKCLHCKERFPLESLKNSHMKEQHKEQLESTAKTCLECNKSFLAVAYYQHMRRAHNEAYACEECGKCFRGQKALEEHKMRHVGVKQYQCDLCLKSYYSQGAVYMHKRYKHKEA